MVMTDIVPLTQLQARFDEIQPSDSEICSWCKEEAEWCDAVSQCTVLDRMSGPVDSGRNQLQLYGSITVG